MALCAVSAFERAAETNRVKVLAERAADRWTGSENIAFKVTRERGADGEWAHESAGARRVWARIRAAFRF